MKKTIVKQVLITVYSDGTTKATPFDPNFAVRDANGRVVKKPRPSKAPHVTPDPMVTCPVCGSTFRVGRSQRRG
jgi:hypothetical protein